MDWWDAASDGRDSVAAGKRWVSRADEEVFSVGDGGSSFAHAKKEVRKRRYRSEVKHTRRNDNRG